MIELDKTDALLEIANSIKLLAGAIGSVNFTLWMFLLFKNMGCNKKD